MTHRSAASPDPPDLLVLTGERTLPGIPDERYWFQRHVVAYLAAAERVAGLAAGGSAPAVLDAGCGEGYGLEMIARAGASRVVGVDLEHRVVDHVRARYADQDPHIEVVAADLSALPLADDEVAMAVSFQVIEHLHDRAGYLDSLVRVTRSDGEIWISTPNRLTFTPGGDTPVNPFHVREFSADELAAELRAAGLVVDRLLGVNHGARLRDLERQRGTTVGEALSATPPEAWDTALRDAVHATRPTDFELRSDDLDRSLDLLAIVRVPPAGSDTSTSGGS